jgi:oligosaccharyltransferase complex subunit alpha (ribophorin I)
MKLFVFVLICIALTRAAVETVNSELSVDNVERTIDIASQLVKMTTKLTISNGGRGAVKSFHYAIEQPAKANVAFIGATAGATDKTYLRVSEAQVRDGPAGAAFYRIELKKALAAGESATVDVEVVLGKALEMFPAEIVQRERQLVLYTGNHYSFIPYKSKTQTTKVTLASANIESYTKLKPVSQSDTTITYGPYSNVEAFSFDEMSIHYENNSPFLVISKMERVVELSMWGNIAVEETIDVRHNGASLKGSFSRYEFQRENSGVSSVKSFKTFLPAAASDVYYRDDIGNISTSALRVLDDAVEVDLRPRFPLFGGWKTHYFLGYNVPSYEYLFNNGDDFVLNMRLLDHVFDHMLVEDFTLKIILPEGCKVGKFDAPYPTSMQADGLHFTYLDTYGRPVVTVRNIGDMTEKHIMDFQLAFKFSMLTMIREPLILIAAFFIFFFLAIIYVRMDFSISKDEGYEARLKVSGLCEKLTTIQDRRWGNYEQFDDALVKLKASKDVNAFKLTAKKIGTDQKAESQAIADLSASLRTASADVADKVSELQKLDGILREHQANQAALAEKLVIGKLGKQQFIEQEAVVTKKKDECKERILAIVSHLQSM